MPRFNSSGWICAGVGDGVVKILSGVHNDGKVGELGRGGSACWRGDHVVYGGPYAGRWATLTGAGHLLDRRAANFIAAAGDVWAGSNGLECWGNIEFGPEDRFGLMGTDGRCPADRSGTIALTNPAGQGFQLAGHWGRSGVIAPGRAIYNLTVLGPEAAIWPWGGRWETIGVPTPPQTPPAAPGRTCWCEVNGQVWLVYYAHNLGLVAQPFGDDRFIVLDSVGVSHHYDAIGIGGDLWVTWGDPGEKVVEAFKVDLSLLSESKPKPKPDPDPEPDPDPDPDPETEKETKMIEIVRQVRAKYPTPLGDRHAEFLIEVASATGKGLLRKDSGTRILTRLGPVAQDILTDPGGTMHYDILMDGEGAAEPTWSEVGPYDKVRYVAVPKQGSDPEPDPDPDPEPDPQPDPNPGAEAILFAILRELVILNRHLGARKD